MQVQHRYFLLVILTTSTGDDLEEFRAALTGAAGELALSVIVVGIGSKDFAPLKVWPALSLAFTASLRACRLPLPSLLWICDATRSIPSMCGSHGLICMLSWLAYISHIPSWLASSAIPQVCIQVEDIETLRLFNRLSCEFSLVGLSQLSGVYSPLRICIIAQKATIDRTGVETMSSMSNGRRVSRNSLDTRNMAQFISLDPKSGINYDAAAEEVLAKVCADAAEQLRFAL